MLREKTTYRQRIYRFSDEVRTISLSPLLVLTMGLSMPFSGDTVQQSTEENDYMISNNLSATFPLYHVGIWQYFDR